MTADLQRSCTAAASRRVVGGTPGPGKPARISPPVCPRPGVPTRPAPRAGTPARPRRGALARVADLRKIRVNPQLVRDGPCNASPSPPLEPGKQIRWELG